MKYGERVLKLEDPAMTGEDVLDLQRKIVAFGSKDKAVPCDGTFDEVTEHAVKKFQVSFGLKETGVADVWVFSALDQWARDMKPIMQKILEKYKCDHSNVTGTYKTHCDQLWTDRVEDEIDLVGGVEKAGNAPTCDGFGSSLSRVALTHSKTWNFKQYANYTENPGIDKTLFWLLMGTMHIYGINDLHITNGYRCNYKYWRINKVNGNASLANHTGHACDFRIPGNNVFRPNGKKLTVVTNYETKKKHCGEVRDDLAERGVKETFNSTVKNRPRTEPRDAAPTWIHLDTTVYKSHFYVKSVDDALAPFAETIKLPIEIGGSLVATPASLQLGHHHVEKEYAGGYFPIGANTLWHGGVHLRTGVGSLVYSFMAGIIVAARLCDDLLRTNVAYGSQDFILVKHQLGEKFFYSLYMHLGYKDHDPEVKFIKKIDWLNRNVTGYRVKANKSLKYRSVPTARDNDHLGILNGGQEVGLLEFTDSPPWARVKLPNGKSAYIYASYALVDEIKEQSKNILKKLASNKIIKLNIPVKAGELLWASGYYGSPGHQTGLMHWEIFSEEYLFEKAEKEEISNGGGSAGALTRQILIKKVNGPTSGNVGRILQYKVTEFNVSDPSDSEKKHVNWKVELNGKTLADFGKHGDTLKYKIPPDAAGESILVMPYMNSPTPKISVRTVITPRIPVEWEQVEDNDSDFNVDSKSILDLFGKELLGTDQVLDTSELKQYYAENKDGNVEKLRSYACKFVSEWGVPDISAAIDKITGLGYFNTIGLKHRLEPYVWWKQATDAEVDLPDSADVWHYNPLRFSENFITGKESGRITNPYDLSPHQEEVETFISKNGIIPREEWGKLTPRYSKIKPDWGYNCIVIHHAGDRLKSIDDPTPLDIEELHMKTRGFDDVGYHFMVDLKGETAYEGRKLFLQGAYTVTNEISTHKIGILALGDFQHQFWDPVDNIPADEQIKAIVDLVLDLKGMFTGLQYLGGHRDWDNATVCPGDELYKHLDHIRNETGLKKPNVNKD